MRFRVQRCVFRAKDGNTLRKFSVVSQLPCISTGGIAQRLSFTGIVGIFVVTHTDRIQSGNCVPGHSKTDDHNPRSTHRALDSRYNGLSASLPDQINSHNQLN